MTSFPDLGLKLHIVWDFSVCASGKEPTCQWRRCKRHWFDPWVEKSPWRRAWQPTPVFLPEEFYGQRNPVGYSSWGCKELNTTEVTLHACTQVSIRMSCPSLYHPMTNVKPIPPHQNLTESYFLSRVRWPEEKVSSYPGPSLLNLKLAFRKHRMGTLLLWNGFIVAG